LSYTYAGLHVDHFQQMHIPFEQLLCGQGVLCMLLMATWSTVWYDCMDVQDFFNSTCTSQVFDSLADATMCG